MARTAGQLVRCTCARCGAVELSTGCTRGFQCHACRPVRAASHPKCRAHRAVARAIADGLLRPVLDCQCVDCGQQAEHYGHRDYSKPLEVQPVCRRCNFKRGPALNGGAPGRSRARRVFAGLVNELAGVDLEAAAVKPGRRARAA